MACNTTSSAPASLKIFGGRQWRGSPSSTRHFSLPSSTNKSLSISSLVLQTRPSGIVRVVTEEIDIAITGGGGDGFNGDKGDGGNGGGNGKGDGGGSGPSDNEGEGDSSKNKSGMSMSQKLTLAYAALIGVGGVMGYLKSGSQKSLAAGGLSALLLYYVYTQLPVRPAFASSLGLGLSAALLAVMGSRFKKSGKIFPAGVVSFVSLVMSGGYLHGIMRSLH